MLSDRLAFFTERPPHVTSRRRLAAAFAGGALFGLGAQLARGCTSGAALSGMAVMSFGGILTMLVDWVERDTPVASVARDNAA